MSRTTDRKYNKVLKDLATKAYHKSKGNVIVAGQALLSVLESDMNEDDKKSYARNIAHTKIFTESKDMKDRLKKLLNDLGFNPNDNKFIGL